MIIRVGHKLHVQIAPDRVRSGIKFLLRVSTACAMTIRSLQPTGYSTFLSPCELLITTMAPSLIFATILVSSFSFCSCSSPTNAAKYTRSNSLKSQAPASEHRNFIPIPLLPNLAQSIRDFTMAVCSWSMFKTSVIVVRALQSCKEVKGNGPEPMKAILRIGVGSMAWTAASSTRVRST